MAGLSFPDNLAAARQRLQTLGLSYLTPIESSPNPWLYFHTLNALTPLVHGLDLSRHTRTNGQALDCHCVFVDDPEPIALAADNSGSSAVVVSLGFLGKLGVISGRLHESLGRLNRQKDFWPAAEPPNIFEKLGDISTELIDAETGSFPSFYATKNCTAGGFAVYYDLVRLVLAHEVFHVVFGHAEFAAKSLGMSGLADIGKQCQDIGIDRPDARDKKDILQGFELHADGAATRLNVGSILWGVDPAGAMMRESVGLIERLTIFNIACALFAVLWKNDEDRQAGGRTTHPPSALRYLNLRDYQREVAAEYAVQEKSPVNLADFRTFRYLSELAERSCELRRLLPITPMVARNPYMEKLAAESDRLLAINKDFSVRWHSSVYFPTQKAWADDR